MSYIRVTTYSTHKKMKMVRAPSISCGDTDRDEAGEAVKA
jgi:hypothetical protein